MSRALVLILFVLFGFEPAYAQKKVMLMNRFLINGVLDKWGSA